MIPRKHPNQPDLDKRMIQRADKDGLALDHALRVRARELNEALTNLLNGEPDPDMAKAKRALGCWARARRAWSEYTGEPLL
jgi:hypothetical protein